VADHSVTVNAEVECSVIHRQNGSQHVAVTPDLA